MAEITIEHGDTSPCEHCGTDVPLEAVQCGSCDEDIPQRVHIGTLLVAFTTGIVIDVRRGGLVLGRHDKTDDIAMWRATGNGVLQLCGFMQGGEYIVNCVATHEHHDRLMEINAYTEEEYEPLMSIPITDTTRLFNTNGTGGPGHNSGVLVHSGQYVVNRAASKKYYSELQTINDSASPELG